MSKATEEVTVSSETVKVSPTRLLELSVRTKAAMSSLNKKYGENSILQLGTNPESTDVVGVISTGSISLDLALGLVKHNEDGSTSLGMPRGRTVEIYGPESSGKTTLCNHIIGNAQRNGLLCAFIDMEHAWDSAYAAAVGVDVANLLVSQPSYAEQALETAQVLVQSMDVGVIVIDSVASLVPQSEVEGEITDQSMGVQSKLMSKALRMLTPIINQSNCLVIFTNQIREKIGVMFGSPETTPGGRALKFFCSVRLDMRKKEVLKNAEEGEAVGHNVTVKVVKNKLAPPFRVAEFNLMYGKGIDIYDDLMTMALKHGVFVAKGSWVSYGDERIGQGKRQCAAVLENNPELYAKVRGEVILKAIGA